MSFTDWSPDNASNATVGAINIAENCPPGNLNNAIREVMAELATFFAPSAGAINITAGGTGATTAAGARTALGVAASGANADITSLTGLTTPLGGAEGGTGIAGVQSAFSAGGSGYMKFYSGLIIQWGTASLGASGSSPAASTNFSFPVAFPTACWLVTGNADGPANPGWGCISVCFPLVTPSGAGVTAHSGNVSQNIVAGRNIRWLAIGN